MFFKKASHNHSSELDDTHPEQGIIYVLGDDELAFFLTAKIQESGQKSILLTPSAPSFGSKEIKITLKEEYNLQKKDLSLKAGAHIILPPQMIIISCRSNSLRAHMTLLPSLRYPELPIISFNRHTDMESIHSLLGINFYQAYFKGYLTQNGSNLTACGQLPEIIISSATKEDEKLTLLADKLKQTGLKLKVEEKDIANFWHNNASRIIGYLFSSPKQHIIEFMNIKENKEALINAIHEICRLAKYEKVKLSEEEIMRELIDTPRNFYYKNSNLSKIENASQLEKLYSMLSEKARAYKCKIPQLNGMIKENYKYLLKK